MLRADAQATFNKNAAQAVRDGTQSALRDAGQAGLNRALDEVPHGATEGLAHSAFGPTDTDDGGIVWGFSAEYARFVEEGTEPHWAPIAPIKKWARRVTGKGESFAYYVQWKIAQEGTDPQPFVQPGIDAMKAKLRSMGIPAHITEKL